MKVFSALHNPKTKKYTTYYSIVLVIVSITVFFTTLQVIHQNPLSSVMTFFEGFFSLFMLTRNEIVGKSFLTHISRIKSSIKQSIPLP
ncbi:MAG: hypothetical protein ACYC6W_07320 [Nitrosotalea sp.]